MMDITDAVNHVKFKPGGRWMYVLSLEDIWDKMNDIDQWGDEESLRTFALIISQRLRLLRTLLASTTGPENMEHLINLFESVQDEDDYAAMNYRLKSLYDICDIEKVWIDK